MRFLSFFFVIAAATISEGQAKAARPVLQPFSRKTALSIRGGAGPLDVDTVAKVLTTAGVGQGWVASVAPEPTLKKYGMKNVTPVTENLMRTLGAAIFSIGVTAFCLFFKKTDVNTAVGWYSIVWLTEHIKALLNKQESKLEADATFRYVWSIIALVMSHACFTDASYATTGIKVTGILTILTCLPVMIDPARGLGMYGYKEEDMTDDALIVARSMGIWLVAAGMFVTALAFGVEPTQALGWVSCIGFCRHLSHSLGNKPGIPKGPNLFWTVFHGVAAFTLSFRASSAAATE